MSQIALTPNASGTGTFTIAAPNSNTDRTLTLPDETGTMLTSASNLTATQLTGDIAAARITTALNATGSAPIYACRAWVNFNGVGTVAIRASGNVSSITDLGVGNYTVNFITAMPNANYSAQVTKEPSAFLGGNVIYDVRSISTTSTLRIINAENGVVADSVNVNISIFC